MHLSEKQENIYTFAEKIGNLLFLFVFLCLIWFALTSSIKLNEIITGILISSILSLILFRDYVALGLPKFSIKRLVFFFTYLFVLFIEIIKANFDVAYRILHPKMPIKPGIVIIKTKLKSNIAKLALANSITLTPGTFTLDIAEDKLLIHWINVKSTNDDEATKIISRKFEKHLLKIFV
ncbi:Na+/H+ antiporter subunit E [candidate division WOR-3 bacterium]|nr:Na+/H+ antiporter subunit E [candidate division WOR-3 bacterium]